MRSRLGVDYDDEITDAATGAAVAMPPCVPVFFAVLPAPCVPAFPAVQPAVSAGDVEMADVECAPGAGPPVAANICKTKQCGFCSATFSAHFAHFAHSRSLYVA